MVQANTVPLKGFWSLMPACPVSLPAALTAGDLPVALYQADQKLLFRHFLISTNLSMDGMLAKLNSKRDTEVGHPTGFSFFCQEPPSPASPASPPPEQLDRSNGLLHLPSQAYAHVWCDSTVTWTRSKTSPRTATLMSA